MGAAPIGVFVSRLSPREDPAPPQIVSARIALIHSLGRLVSEAPRGGQLVSPRYSVRGEPVGNNRGQPRGPPAPVCQYIGAATGGTRAGKESPVCPRGGMCLRSLNRTGGGGFRIPAFCPAPSRLVAGAASGLAVSSCFQVVRTIFYWQSALAVSGNIPRRTAFLWSATEEEPYGITCAKKRGPLTVRF